MTTTEATTTEAIKTAAIATAAIATEAQALLRLLQLSSPALPVGAYSYSEGLETLVEQGVIATAAALGAWLEQELAYGMAMVDGTALGLAHRAAQRADWGAIAQLNAQLSARRDSEETRQQSWDMGRALVRTATQLHRPLQPQFQAVGSPCNFAIAFALVAVDWEIGDRPAVLGYLHSWAANLVTSAIKLVPLGQTEGQRILLELAPALEAAGDRCLATASLDDCYLSSWGTSLASLQHEALYTRLFRS
jgi:urease accessory protein